MRLKGRGIILIVSILFVFGALTYRIVTLHVLEQGFLLKQGEARTTRLVSHPPSRGMIVDRFGEALAISTPVDSIWINPKEFDPNHPQLLTLASVLDISLLQVLEKVERSTAIKGRDFVYLKRQVAPTQAEQIKNLKMPGVYLKQEFRRYYPAGEITAHVLGFTDIDDAGQEGLELAFDDWLSGEAGQKRIVRDRRGREVQILEGLKEKKEGADLALSLDSRLQYLAYRELKNSVVATGALGGSAVALDVQTGEVLAMVNQPSFNPNQRIRIASDDRYRNRAVTDTFEPGSSIKTFSVVSALLHGQISPKTLVDTAPGWMAIGKHVVKEDNNKNFGVIDVANILQVSSNVGVTKLTLSLPPERLRETYTQLGFGFPTGCGFPGESGGSLRHFPKHSGFVLATLAFGYGMSVTPLQLAQAYAILGAGGIKRPITLVKQQTVAKGERVIDSVVARQVVSMLKDVVEQGSGFRAQVVGYHTAGKTGTARKINSQGEYEKNSHIAVFAGLAPANHPRFVIVVMIDDPKGPQYYGSQVAAPLFSKIAAGALRLYSIPPDAVESENLRVAKINDEKARLHD